MFERFTERARQVVINAQDEARTAKSPTINEGHLLLGLVNEIQDGSLAHIVLTEFGVEYGALRDFVVDSSDSIDADFSHVQIPMSITAKKILELALREALSLGHNYIGTEHILLGLVRENRGISARALSLVDLTPEKIRNEIIRQLSGPREKPVPPTNDLTVALDELSDLLAAMQSVVQRVKAAARA